MHQTTIRFPADTWAEIEREAGAMGVSAAQYVRDAALARLAYTAGRQRSRKGVYEMSSNGADAAHARAVDALEGSEAVWAQARLARTRARSTREAARIAQQRRLLD